MKKLVALSILLGLLTICCHINENILLPPDLKYISADGPIPDRIYLNKNQNWEDSIRDKFYYTSQGSQIMPYDWFTWLEQPDNNKYFRNTDHMDGLGFIPDRTSRYNPSGLPMGFAMTRAKKYDDAYMGLTCAACHTNQLDYKGNKYVVEGAPTLGNFVLFYDRVIDALNKTLKDKDKFERFSRRVLGGKYSEKAAAQLRSEVLEAAEKAFQRKQVNALPPDYPDDFTSYGRLDAFGNIANAGSSFALGDLSNKNYTTGPVSYPFLWGSHQSDFVQWNASAANITLVGPLVRNVGEVVGVFGGLRIKKAGLIKKLFGKDHVYSSTVDYHGLGALEGYVSTLTSPKWSDTNLPPIDPDLRDLGEELFAKVGCDTCHQVILRQDELEKYKCVKTKLTDVRTDPITAWNIENHYAKTLILEGVKANIVVGERFADTTRAINLPLNGVVGLVLKNPVKALEAGIITNDVKGKKSWKEEMDKNNALQDSIIEHNASNIMATESNIVEGKDVTNLVYKARPLNGIWATAPFLHNGAIPNLWALMQKPEDRPTEFWVGWREFDPKNVGFHTDRGKSLFKVTKEDGTIMPGNSNRGHEYGTDLTDKEKWAIVEYMKTL